MLGDEKLTPAAFEKIFYDIDEDRSGNISKEEMEKFIK